VALIAQSPAAGNRAVDQGGRPAILAARSTPLRNREMSLESVEKQTVITKFRLHESDTGSPEVQIALLSQRIDYLTDHFKIHKKDHHSRRGLLALVSQRRSLLNYLKNCDIERYRKVVSSLNLRK
jgi:small subunit ribosomal protein S15